MAGYGTSSLFIYCSLFAIKNPSGLIPLDTAAPGRLDVSLYVYVYVLFPLDPVH